jgi:serine/threonine protein kinase
LTYVGARQNRLNHFKAEFPEPPATDEETYNPVWSKYVGRERANLRKRRVRLRQGDFQILTQVGQGGYGQVFLAQKKDTREVCALKVMSKKLLFKLDEIRHVLTERDILTNAKSEWLVRLLYSFQDDKSIYLAMVRMRAGIEESRLMQYHRSTYLVETSEPFSTILVFLQTAMPASTSPRCSALSMLCTNLAIFIEISNRKTS